MNFQINEQAAIALSKRKKHHIYVLVVAIAAVFTVVGVVYALTRPGRAFSSLEKTLECAVDVHQHTEQCYDAEGKLICGMADYVAHIHDPELCYDDNGELVCQLPEIIPHEHGDSCYLEKMELICGIEEGQVVDANGVAVFDAEGNPVFNIDEVSDISLIDVEGEIGEENPEGTEETAGEETTPGENTENAEETGSEGVSEEETEGTSEEGETSTEEKSEATEKGEASTDEKSDATGKGETSADGKSEATEKGDASTDGKSEATESGDTSTEEKTGTSDNADSTAKEDSATGDNTADNNTESAAGDKGNGQDAPTEGNTDETPTVEDTALDAPAEETAPQETTPQETTPQETTPQETTPQETSPQSNAASEEIVSETVDFNANADDGTSQYTYHTHTAECYKIVKELICTEQTLHVHTAECYDENGVLSCGQLQLSMHVHGDECFHFEEKTVTKTATAGNYTVTATYGASAKIPSKAEFRAEIIEPESAVYVENENAMKSAVGEDAEAQVMFNIGFYVNGEEIEPEGPVSITFKLNEEDYSSGDELTVIHVQDDGTVNVDSSTIDGNNNASITTDSFSVYILLNNGNSGVVKPGKYGRYTVGINDTRDAFRYSPEYAAYRSVNSELGIAANFHIVAFGTFRTASHVNGNVCARNAYCPNNFGTNNLGNELSYIQNYHEPNSNSGTGLDSTMLVIGSSNTLKITGNNGGDEIHIISPGGTEVKIDNPSKIVIDSDTGSNPFIDIDALERELISVRNSLASVEDVNVKTYFTGDDNGSYIELTDPEVAGYFNTTGSFINTYGGVNLKLDGFKSGYNGTLIINVDCSDVGVNGEGIRKLQLPKSANVYVDGVVQSTGEVTTFENGKVIWNFTNCAGVDIYTNQMTGIILAPEANVVAEGNLNGQIIAKDIKCTGETHRVSFTGTMVPFKASFKAGKTVDGKTPTQEQVFRFGLYEYADGNWNLIETASNNGSSISFDTKVTYNDKSQVGNHYFKIAEIPESKNENDSNSYVYDTTEYIVKVIVKLSGNNYTADYEFYKVGENGLTVVNNDFVFDSASAIGAENIIFNNVPNNTEISVEKQWLDYKGEELTEDLPESLTVYLYRTTDTNAVPDESNLIDTVSLTADTGWKYEWKNLPKLDEQGRTLYYFAKEEEKAGFISEASKQTWFEFGIQKFINKKPSETTKIEVDKKFVAFTLEGDEIVLTNPRPDGGDYKNDYVRFKLVRNVTVNGNLTEEDSAYNGKAQIDGAEADIVNGLFEVTGEKEWKTVIDKLPSVEYIGADLYEYEYKIIETSDSSLNYAFLRTETEEVSENGKTYTKYVVTNGLKTTELEIDKNWLTYTGTIDSMQTNKDSELFIRLYLTANNEENTTHIAKGSYLLGAVSIDNSDSVYSGELIEDVSSETKTKLWAFKVTGLPMYYGAKQEDGSAILKKYVYSVTEDPLDGYEFITEPRQLSSGEAIEASVTTASLNDENAYNSIVIKNMSESHFSLPETGGAGHIIPVYIAGAVVILATIALLVYRRKLRKN
ncbi:MAG: choice-of-anchor A family protein [Lachnospiraceae bacterium]|nr:choice-of-anchor A family protein [Lachnospiraceae bacterium]